MAIPDVQVTPAEVREIVLRELRNSDLGVLVRQLQGGLATTGLSGRKVSFGRFPGWATVGASVETDFNISAGSLGLSTVEGIVASAWPNSTWAGFSVKGMFYDMAGNQGIIHVANGATAQTFDLSYIAIGTP